MSYPPSALGSPRNQKKTLLRWIQFNAVGGIGIVVQLAALAVFRSWLRLDYLLATGLAVEMAVIRQFFVARTFYLGGPAGLRRLQSVVRLAKFNASNGAVSLAGNLLLMRVLVGGFQFNYVASNVVAVGVCSVVNFLLGDRFVFDSSTAC